MKKCFVLLVLIAAFAVASCVQKKFERMEQTLNARYSIVYDNGKCGVYDNETAGLSQNWHTTSSITAMWFPRMM